MEVAPDTLDFGMDRTELPLSVDNAGGGVLYWCVELPSIGWIGIKPSQGEIAEVPSTVGVRIDRARAPEGSFEKRVRIVGSDGTSRQVVLMAQIEKPELSVPCEGLTFGAGDLSKTMTIQSKNRCDMNWAVTPPAARWLQVDPLQGKATEEPSHITVTADRSKVTRNGTYATDLHIDSDEGSALVPVQMVVEGEAPSIRLRVSPDSLGFGTASVRQVITISSADGGELAWQVDAEQPWLKMTPTSGGVSEGGAQVIVEVDRELLSDGENGGSIVVAGAGDKIVIPVTALTLTPVLWVNEYAVDFRDDLNVQTIEVANAGIGDLSWTCEKEATWLEIEPPEGTTGRSATPVALRVKRKGMGIGSYQTELMVTSNGGCATIEVRMEVSNNPLSVDCARLDFGGELTTRSIGLTNVGEENVSWEAQGQAPWVEIDPKQGTALEDEVQVDFTVDRQNLPSGTYTTRVEFTSGDARREVVVVMTVPERANDPPVADAGMDGMVQAGTSVVLDGSHSRDSDGDSLSYQWMQVEGAAVVLADDQTSKATFTPVEPGEYVFYLVVNDGQENSRPDEVRVSVSEDLSPEMEQIAEALPGGVEMEFVWIDPGSFTIGSPESEPGHEADESPQHRVTLSRGFYLGRYEVTQEQWVSVMGDNPSFYSGANHPVEQVSWEDVQEFIHRWHESLGDSLFRLPTEAEWEYACRAGTTERWSFGDAEGELGDYAWYEGNNSPIGTKEVGTKSSNPWGLYDMHGNVSEWCQDHYGPYTEGWQVDPSGPESGTDRIIRGGHFGGPVGELRSADRGGPEPSRRAYSIGLRLIKSR